MNLRICHLQTLSKSEHSIRNMELKGRTLAAICGFKRHSSCLAGYFVLKDLQSPWSPPESAVLCGWCRSREDQALLPARACRQQRHTYPEDEVSILVHCVCRIPQVVLNYIAVFYRRL